MKENMKLNQEDLTTLVKLLLKERADFEHTMTMLEESCNTYEERIKEQTEKIARLTDRVKTQDHKIRVMENSSFEQERAQLNAMPVEPDYPTDYGREDEGQSLGDILDSALTKHNLKP